MQNNKTDKKNTPCSTVPELVGTFSLKVAKILICPPLCTYWRAFDFLIPRKLLQISQVTPDL